MKFSLAKTVLFATILWLILWIIFWAGALAWLHISYQEVYAFLAPGKIGDVKSIDGVLLGRFHSDERLAVIISFLSALVVSQTSLIISTLRK